MNEAALKLLAQAANSGSEGLSLSSLLRGVVGSLVYSTIGLVMFAIAFMIINKAVPFSLRKEIEDDQNTALGIVIAAVILGIAMIVSAAVHG
jgi:putative membrane protein